MSSKFSDIQLRGIDQPFSNFHEPSPLASLISNGLHPWLADPWFLFAFLTGLVLGSFGNACIFRWPREESVRSGRSFCPHCQKTILWFDNIPLLSWFLLMGKCRRCRGPISIRYPLTELLCGMAFALSYAAFHNSHIVASSLFLWALVVVFWIDIDHRIIPNEITIPLTISGIILAPWILPSASDVFLQTIAFFAGVDSLILPLPVLSMLGAAVGGGFVLVIRWIGQMIYGQEAMGLGDVKLLMFVGAWLGPAGALKTLFLGSIIGGVLSIALLLIRRVGRRSYIPFGPFLAIGAALALFRLP
ncbi:MAG: prepilin peptidase [Candidatus Hydrogenedentota bacterium]